jgi:tetratricopeptide (TPR) repeat protein
MRLRIAAAAVAALAVMAAAVPDFVAPALAQLPQGKGHWVGPPKKLPKVSRKEQVNSVDFLFGALKAAPDDETARAIEQRIWALWMRSRSDTATLLMTRAQKAIEDKDLDLALKLLDGIVKVKPDYLEAWNRRATLYYMKKDYGHSIADIREVLKREPRHFGALTGLGLILQDIGDDKQALEVYRRALAVYPRIERVPDIVKTLTEKVEGRDI